MIVEMNWGVIGHDHLGRVRTRGDREGRHAGLKGKDFRDLDASKPGNLKPDPLPVRRRPNNFARSEI